MSDSSRKEIKQEVYARIIEAFRESLGVTVQQEIADLLGVKKQKLQDWKNGRSDPRDYIVEISELTGRSFKWLLTGKEEKDKIEQVQAEKTDYPAYSGPLFDKCMELLELVIEADDRTLEGNLLVGLEALCGVARSAANASSESGGDEGTGQQRRKLKRKPDPSESNSTRIPKDSLSTLGLIR